jgi:flagellar M-ring protein FliF
MNFLNQAIAQVSELFRSMTPGARITAGLLLAVVVVSFGYLFRQGTAGADAYLFGAEVLSDGDLNRIEMAIASANLSGHEREGNRIRVPAGQKAAYLAAIADAGAEPANFNTILERALNNSSPWESREAARERIKDARQRQLSEIVRAMRWVEEAVVIIDEQEPKGLAKQKVVTASISVQPAAGETLDPMRADKLKKFLAKSVSGLNPDSVHVTDLGDGGGFITGGGIDPAMFDNQYYKDKVRFELRKRDQILGILRPSIPDVMVEVNAEIDDTATETITTRTPDKESATLVRSSDTSETSKQSTADGGGRPGPVTNSAAGPGGQAVAEAQRQDQSETSGSTVEETYDVGGKDQVVVRQGFTPKEILASVVIPSSHFEKVWRQRNTALTNPPSPEDLKAIETEVITNVESIVEPLLLKSADRSRDTFRRVKVVSLATLPEAPIVPPSMSSKAIAWTGQYWNTLAMLGVAMFSLMVLRSMVKGAPGPAAPHGAHAAPELTLTSEAPAPGHAHAHAHAHDAAEPAAEAPPDDRPRLRLRKGTSIKDDLVDIVREDPDAAADILRSWIGKAG